MITPAEHFSNLIGLLYKLGVIQLDYAVHTTILMPTFVLHANLKFHQENPDYWTKKHG